MTATLRFDVVSQGAAARRDLSATRRDLEKFGSSSDRVASQTSRAESKMSKAFGALKRYGPLAAAAAGAALVKFGVDAVKSASETEQALGAVDSVFGKNADTVRKWADGAADAVGLARSEYANLAATLGASLKNSGIENYARETDKLIRLGGDLAATFGGETSEAVAALGSLLRGEADPIERYGVSIKQVDVNARLAAKGQDKLEGAALRQAEQLARLELVMEQTTDAQGAFKREAGTLAGAQQRLTAKWENAKDTLGRKLLPIAGKVTTWLSNTIDGSNKAGRAVRRMGEDLVRVAGWISRNVIGPLSTLAREADKIEREFARGRDSTNGFARAMDRASRSASKLEGELTTGQKLQVGIMVVGTAAEMAADRIGEWVGHMENAKALVESITSRLWDFRDAILNIPQNALTSALNLGSLLRSGDAIDAGLARAGGAGMIGGTTLSPAINLTSSPSVRVEVDSAAMARLFRVIVQDELTRAATTRGART